MRCQGWSQGQPTRPSSSSSSRLHLLVHSPSRRLLPPCCPPIHHHVTRLRPDSLLTPATGHRPLVVRPHPASRKGGGARWPRRPAQAPTEDGGARWLQLLGGARQRSGMRPAEHSHGCRAEARRTPTPRVGGGRREGGGLHAVAPAGARVATHRGRRSPRRQHPAAARARAQAPRAGRGRRGPARRRRTRHRVPGCARGEREGERWGEEERE